MKVGHFAIVIGLALLLGGCATVNPQGGLFYHDIKYGINATESSEATKTGEACTTSILGLVGSGDASIEEAKKDGGITKVSSIDASSSSLFFFYNKYCTIVKGN